MGLSTGSGFLFGGAFVAVGTCVILIGTKVLPVNPASVHAPYWVLTAAGSAFALGGLMVWGMAWKQFQAERRRKLAVGQSAAGAALADYPWQPEGFEVSEWAGAAKAAGAALGLTLFISIFNWAAFWAANSWLFKVIATLMDCFGLVMWGRAGRQLLSALKFGRSRVLFTSFPYPTSAPVILRWQPAAGVSRLNRGTFTLRCIEEWTESRGSGENRTVSLVQEEVWSAKWVIEQPRNLQFGETVDLRYELPPEAQSTRLSADRPVCWELVVKLDLPGLDFQETYLVPIYASRAPAPKLWSAVAER